MEHKDPKIDALTVYNISQILNMAKEYCWEVIDEADDWNKKSTVQNLLHELMLLHNFFQILNKYCFKIGLVLTFLYKKEKEIETAARKVLSW